jgi:predicted GNAT family acetyltransferase
MAEPTPIPTEDETTDVVEVEAPEEAKIPAKYLKKLDPSVVKKIVDPRMVDDLDVERFVRTMDRESSSTRADPSFDQQSIKKAFDSYGKRAGLTPVELEDQLGKLKVEPTKILSELREGKNRVEIIEGLKSRTLAGTTKKEREVGLRGETILQLGTARAEAKIGRTVEKTGKVPLELLLPDETPKFDTESVAGFFGTDTEDVKDMTQKGDRQYGELEALNNVFEEMAQKGDKRMMRMIELRDKWSDAELGAEKYTLERAEDILKWKGISTDDPNHEEALKRAMNRAIKEIGTWKTIGLWTAPTFIRYNDPAAKHGKELSWGQAFLPTVEVVGLDRHNKPVLRSQSSLQWGLEINDLFQSALVGAFTEDHADLGQRMLLGIANRRNLFEAALDSDLAKTNTAAKVTLGLAAFAGSVLMPDLTFGAASAYKAGSIRLGRFISGKKLTQIADLHEAAATKLAEGLASGDRKTLSESAEIAGQINVIAPHAPTPAERKALKEAGDIGAETREKAGVVMDRVDQSDFDAARRLGRENQDILATKQGNELADSLPGRLGDERMNLHPSVRRRQAREGGKAAKEGDYQEAGGIEYKNVYDYGDQLDEVDKTRALIDAKDAGVYGRFVRNAMVGESGAFKAAIDVVKEVEGVAPRAADALSRALKDYTALARDPEAWVRNVNSALDGVVSEAGDEASKIIKSVEGAADEVGLIETMRVAAQGAIEEAGDFDDLAKLVDRAEEAIKTNIESRAIAHAFDRSLIHGELGLKSSPIIAESVAKVKEIQELSDEGISFMDQAIKFFGVSKDEAIDAARIYDLAAKRWAKKSGREDPSKWWETRLEGIQSKSDFAKRFGFEDSGGPFSNILHPASHVQSALPKGYRLVGIGETTARLIGNPHLIRAKLVKILAKKYGASEYGLRTKQAYLTSKLDKLGNRLFSDEEIELVHSLISGKHTKPGLFRGKLPKQGSDYGSWKIDPAFLDGVLGSKATKPPPQRIKEAFDELEELGFLVQEPKSWKIIDDATGKAISEGDDLSSVTGTALQKLVDDGVIVRSAEDIKVGHELQVGPISIGMDIDSVDQAIGGYNFEYGAGWIDGVSFFRMEGTARKVPFTLDEFRVLALGKNTQFTHNHPFPSWFSGGTGDMGFMAVNNVNEMRVVWPDGTMIKLEAPNGWGKLAWVARQHADELFPLTADFEKRTELLDELDPSGILSKTSRTEAIKQAKKWTQAVGSYVLGPSKKVANNARKAATQAGKDFSDRDWAVAYTKEANKRIVKLGRRFEVDLRISVRQPEESLQLGRSRPGLTSEGLTPGLARAQVDVTGEGAEVFFQGVQRQPGVEFKEIGEGLVELTTDAVRAAGGEGLTFRVVDGALSVDAVSIPAELQGRGIGSDLYRNALEYARDKGFGFASDVSPSRDAVAVYERLISEGVPLVRKMVRAPDGAMVRQYVADADSLKKAAQPLDADVLYQTGRDYVGGTGDDLAKGATEFLEDGKAIIYALEQPDFTTLIHEMGHVLRRDLDAEDFEKVGSWVKSLGADVTIRGGRFIGEPAEVRKAEEFFAEAFEQYIKDGEPPVEDLRSAFERMKDFMTQAVRYLAPSAKVTPEMKRVFDNLLVEATPDEPLLPRITRMLKKTLIGPDKTSKFDVIKAISDDARRLGIEGADYDTLIKQFDETGSIKLEGSVLSEYGDAGGAEFSSERLADLRSKMQSDIALGSVSYRPGAATSSFNNAIKDLTPSQRVEQLLRGDGAANRIKAIVKSSFIGGDVAREKGLAGLHPVIRASVETATRQVKQGTAEGIRLVGEATTPQGHSNLLDFLTGKNVSYIKGGRDVLTSGHDSASAVFTQMTKFFDNLAKNETEMKDLIGLADHLAEGGKLEAFSLGAVPGKAGKVLTKGAAEKIWNRTFRQGSAPEFLRAMLEAVAPGTAQGKNPVPKDWANFSEIVLYYMGQSHRNGVKFTGDARAQADGLFKDVEALYDKASAMRIAVLIATHGHADRARKLWSGLGLTIDKDTYTFMVRWINGEDIPSAAVPKVKKLVARFGMRAEFVEDELLGGPFYISKPARDNLSAALARGIDIKNIHVANSEDNMKGIAGVFLRYNKLRMTRGGIMLRQRYFLMNTIDHFAQMAMINGFQPALSSTIRLVAQDVMVLPGVARAVDTLSRTGVLNAKQAEKMRRGLQTAGDTVANFFAKSKYHIKVNPILEGKEGFFRVGGNVYSHKELRDIAVQEGIFASFDTTQLSSSVQRAGRSMIDNNSAAIRAQGGAGARAQDFAETANDFLTQVVADTAEAWGERERLGAMVALMETGLEPRVAARLTIDALYDYAGSMTKLDRHWLVSLALPFWAFQKNANRQFFDTLFSPAGVYRMGVIRRGTARAADALTEIMWTSVSDEFGVDVKALEESGPDGLYQDYMKIKGLIYDQYGDNVPKDVRIGMNMWLRGRQRDIVEGGQYVIPHAISQHLYDGTGHRFTEFARPLPSKSTRASYLRPRDGVLIPFSLKSKATRDYYNALRGSDDRSADSHPYTELFFPDSTINAGMRHMSNMAAFYVLAGMKGGNLLGTLFGEEGAISEVSLMTPAKEVADLERAPVIGEFAKIVTGKEGFPRKIHPFLVPVFETVFPGVRLLQLDAKSDIYTPRGEPGSTEYKSKRTYVFPGYWSMAFDNSLGEINKLLFALPFDQEGMSPLERTATRGKILQWARLLTGVQSVESSGQATVKREAVTRLIETDKPD